MKPLFNCFVVLLCLAPGLVWAVDLELIFHVPGPGYDVNYGLSVWGLGDQNKDGFEDIMIKAGWALYVNNW